MYFIGRNMMLFEHTALYPLPARMHDDIIVIAAIKMMHSS